MNTTSPAAQSVTPALVDGLRWRDELGQVRGFVNGRLWGVKDDAGRWVTFDGFTPWTARTKRTAAMVCEADPAALTYVSAVTA